MTVKPKFGVLIVLASASLLAACKSAALSTGSSMQIEVDVYKGPLSRTEIAQHSDALGAINGARDALRAFVSELEKAYPDPNGDFPGSTPDQQKCNGNEVIDRACRDALAIVGRLDAASRAWGTDATLIRNAELLIPGISGALDGISDATKQRLQGAFQESTSQARLESLQSTIKTLPSQDASRAPFAGSLNAIQKAVDDAVAAQKRAGGHLATALAIARELEERAWYWSTTIVLRKDGGASRGTVTASERTQDEQIVRFAQIAADAANVITSRVDSIDKQSNGRRAAYETSTADHLRDAAPTAHLGMYALFGEPDTKTTYSAAERVKIAERLFDDRYWTNVNRVHASGQGDVRMAFIRDEIGNWNLKSFDSDPEKLLNAYRNLSYASLGFATRIASGRSPGEPGLGQILAGFSRGQAGLLQATTQLSKGVALASGQTSARLKTIRDELDGQKKELDDAVASAEKLLGESESDHAAKKELLAVSEEGAAKSLRGYLELVARNPPATAEELSTAKVAYDSAQADLELKLVLHKTSEESLLAARASLQVAREKRAAAIRGALSEARGEINSYRRNIDVAEATVASP